MRKIGLLFALLMLIGTIFPIAAQDSLPQLVSIQSVEELVGQQYAGQAVRISELSPDGAMLAWWGLDNDICLYRLADEETTCYSLPQNARIRNQPLVWSPDSTQIAFTEDLFIQLRDSDIWVFDAETGITTNRTDDNTYDSLIEISSDSADENIWLDFNPIWHPVTGDVYFFRTTRDESREFPWTLDLYRLPAEGESELVQPLSDTLPGLSIYASMDFGAFDGAAAFSPDGRQLAIVIRSAELDNPKNGIWIINTGSVLGFSVLPYQLYGGVISGGLPPFQENELFIMTVAWSGDNSLVIFAADPRFATNAIYSNIYHLDLTTNAVTPLVDFSDIAEAPDLYANPDDQGNVPAFYMPRNTVILGGDTLVSLNFFTPNGGISMAQLPPEDTGLRFVGMIPDFSPYPARTSSVSSDGKVLLGGYLLTFDTE